MRVLVPTAFGVAIGGMNCANAATITVGPEAELKHIHEAAMIARDGDTVLIMSGTYRGDVAVWPQSKLTIRGVGPRPLLVADGQSADGKGIWVIRNGAFRIENIEFRGARANAGNGAGIRFERGNLYLRDCHFIDNQMGLLTGNDPASTLRIDDSYFSAAPTQFNSLPHLLYVGVIGRFELSGSLFERGFRGHLVKSRARINRISYNWIVDGDPGRASYEIDLPNGGDALLVGNVIGQSATGDNQALISYGVEGFRWPVNRLRLVHNTLISPAGRGAELVRTAPENWPEDTVLETRNNLILGNGHFLDEFELGRSGNWRAALPDSGSPLSPASLRDALERIPVPVNAELRPPTDDARPQSEFAWRLGAVPLGPVKRWLPGAFQARRDSAGAP